MTSARPGPDERAQGDTSPGSSRAWAVAGDLDDPATGSAVPNFVGQALGDRYRLGPLVGRGGTATVYRGHDHTLDRTVAIKLLNLDRSPAPDGGSVRTTEGAQTPAVARLRREAQLVASLNHPNLVTVYDIDAHQDTVFVVMEYVSGRPLRSLLAEHAPLGVERGIEIGAAVCAGLDAAHTSAVIHRDVTPGNILIGADGTTKLTDFGIARATHGLGSTATTAEGQVRGTPAYMSPEQVLGQRPDARSDLYSLGCCLYEIATGRPPFLAGEFVALAHAHVHTVPDPPSAHNPAIPAALDEVILRTLAKEPAERHTSAAALRAALTDYGTIRNDTATATPPPVAREQRREIPAEEDNAEEDDVEDAPTTGVLRHRLGLTLIAAACALLLLAAVLAF